LTEIDLFQTAWNQEKIKKTIAITGTLGKTSITHLLSTILNAQTETTITGGNIGIGMLDLVQSPLEQALLELSSFQLEHTKTFAPDLAIWTNFFPNHLDRHTNLDEYFAAKKNVLLHQKPDQIALVPLELADQLRADKKIGNRPLAFFTTSEISTSLLPHDTLYHFDKAGNILRNNIIILQNIYLPKISYKNNWLIIAAALDLLKLDVQKNICAVKKFTLPDYRLEKVATINGITYYNDSKSTIMQATVAAVNEIQNGPIILLLGGLCKGVDRSQFIKQLTTKVHKIICFGAEAELLSTTCNQCNIVVEAYPTLEKALAITAQQAQSGTSVLFSPGGASFDLFKNYQARGECFKQLVLMLQQQSN
jgi:UDP-N-acetylmuramoylalanine--D-glutamate ligase